jgi:formimidoylglutamate deiminase
MTTIWAKQILTADGWRARARLRIDAQGRISEVVANVAPEGYVADCIVPAPANLHSHAFQRAMAGLTESRNGARDSFWTWRRLMYAFLDQLEPDDVQAIAALVQMEMLEAGYASVAEFHYLHHQPSGAHYADPAEMSAQVCAAAARTGIGLTHLPVLYMRGGCDNRALDGNQQRFGNSLEQFQRLLESAAQHLAKLPADCVLGVAPHSLRAVAPHALEAVSEMRPLAPIHIHIAEQDAEVAEIVAHCGTTPVAWLLDTHALNPRWCLVHATQMTSTETATLARSGATVGLCPITEANLGDGIFNGTAYFDEGGQFGIGSDSNILISLNQELRMLEYSQRLRDKGRAMLATTEKSTGRTLFDATAAGGARALGRNSGRIAPGALADLLELNTQSGNLTGLSGDIALDAFVFSADHQPVKNVWAAGRHVVRAGCHIARAEIWRDASTVLRRLRHAL